MFHIHSLVVHWWTFFFIRKMFHLIHNKGICDSFKLYKSQMDEFIWFKSIPDMKKKFFWKKFNKLLICLFLCVLNQVINSSIQDIEWSQDTHTNTPTLMHFFHYWYGCIYVTDNIIINIYEWWLIRILENVKRKWKKN